MCLFFLFDKVTKMNLTGNVVELKVTNVIHDGKPLLLFSCPTFMFIMISGPPGFLNFTDYFGLLRIY